MSTGREDESGFDCLGPRAHVDKCPPEATCRQPLWISRPTLSHIRLQRFVRMLGRLVSGAPAEPLGVRVRTSDGMRGAGAQGGSVFPPPTGRGVSDEKSVFPGHSDVRVPDTRARPPRLSPRWR